MSTPRMVLKVVCWLLITLAGCFVGILLLADPLEPVVASVRDALTSPEQPSRFSLIPAAAWAGGLGGGVASLVFANVLTTFRRNHHQKA